MTQQIALPVDEILPSLVEVLRSHTCVLICAPPGSGKTTRVPPAVCQALGGSKVILLQPRRLAARASAQRIAYELGCDLGQKVGFRIRFENQTSEHTTIEVLTEGLLTHQLQSDPFLTGIGAVILDEFHERSLNSDIALAMLREIQRDVRPDLKIIVMSATLDVLPVQTFLGGQEACPLIETQGRSFEVDLSYEPGQADRRLESRVASAIERAIALDPIGHILAFLPGVAEIERTAQRLEGKLPQNTTVLPLHGALKSADQDLVLRASPHPKVILATNLAETSLTIDGVTTVIDSGLVRRPRFDLRLGIERLETVPHSQASSTQRAGRAGRTRKGRCVRLWSVTEQSRRDLHDPPEVQRTDLCGTVLQLYAWGTRPKSFNWFEAPPEVSIAHAEDLLMRLGALEGDPKTLTERGGQLARLPIHPRLGVVILRGKELGVLESAAAAAALASERDPWKNEHSVQGDLLERISMLDQRGRTGADLRSLARVRQVRDQLVRIGRRLPGSQGNVPFEGQSKVLDALISGFPDRVGKRRTPLEGAVILSNGGGAQLGRGVAGVDCFVAVVMTAGPRGKPPLIRVTAQLATEDLPSSWEEEVWFDQDREAVFTRRARRFGAILLEEKPSACQPDPNAVLGLLLAKALESFPLLFPMNGEEGRCFRRLKYLKRQRPDIIGLDWLDHPPSLLKEWCVGCRSFAQLRKIDLQADFLQRLTWKQREALNTVAPDRMKLPSGSTARLDYPTGQVPILAARIQQLFGMKKTPLLGGSPITIHLLAPNGRPAQITQDLAHFWAHTYVDVRKDLRGRYPRHAWPEDPLKALPEDRPKRRH